jgi:predicted acetyltransferase
LYERVRLSRAGLVSRPDFWWPSVFWGLAEGAGKAFFVAVHSDEHGNDDGYVAYEMAGEWAAGVPDRRLIVSDLHTENWTARAALWRYVFGVDLVSTVSATNLPIDEPLRHLVTDPRRVRVDFVNDGLWLAPLDPARLLSARRYAADIHLTLEVHHPDGRRERLALDGNANDATCGASDAPADLVCSASTLGAVALGGNRWSELATAGLIDARAPGALARADAAFATSPAPAMLGFF